MLQMVRNVVDVELNKSWLADNGNRYKITEDDIFVQFQGHDDWFAVNESVYRDIILGNINFVWEPQMGDIYFIPDISYSDDFRGFCVRYWSNSEEDKYYYDSNLIFRHKSDAIECSDKMLELMER